MLKRENIYASAENDLFYMYVYPGKQLRKYSSLYGLY